MNILDYILDFQINQYDLMEIFNDANCYTMRGVPKFFVFNYCQGVKVDEGFVGTNTSHKLNNSDALPVVGLIHGTRCFASLMYLTLILL